MPFKTIHIVDLTSDAHLIKEQLEAEEIPVRLLDEDKPDLNYEYSPEMGVKIQVQESDFELANSVLVRYGYINIINEDNTIIHDIDDFTKGLSLIKHWSLETRIISFILFFILVFIAFIVSMYDFD